MTLDVERLRTLLDYDATTGIFVWRVSTGRAFVGKAAGCIDHRGYGVIKIKERRHLREASTGENNSNSKRSIKNTSGFKGVCRSTKNPNRWRAHITKNYKQIYLGTFATEAEAHAAYVAAAHQIHGAFARTS